MTGEFERLAYEAALRSLDKQERLLEELRARTGVLLAASSIAASFLGQQAFQHPRPSLLAVLSLGAFIASIGASVFVLLPKEELTFAETGVGLYEGLHVVRSDISEVHRRLVFDLNLFWIANNRVITKLSRAYVLAASALAVEVISLTVLLGGNLL